MASAHTPPTSVAQAPHAKIRFASEPIIHNIEAKTAIPDPAASHLPRGPVMVPLTIAAAPPSVISHSTLIGSPNASASPAALEQAHEHRE